MVDYSEMSLTVLVSHPGAFVYTVPVFSVARCQNGKGPQVDFGEVSRLMP